MEGIQKQREKKKREELFLTKEIQAVEVESRDKENRLERSRAKLRSLGETEYRQRSELQSGKSVQNAAYSRGESKV